MCLQHFHLKSATVKLRPYECIQFHIIASKITFSKMKYIIMALAIFFVIALNCKTEALNVETMDTWKNKIDVKDPSWGTRSSGILKSHFGLSYHSNGNKTLILSAPKGYGILAAIRLIDFRPRYQDQLTLFAVNDSIQPVTFYNSFSIRYKNYDSWETKTYYAPKGQLGVKFVTGPGFTYGYDGFELTYTVQANSSNCAFNFKCWNKRCIAHILQCDGHNHCGDRSDQMNCSQIQRRSGRIAGIICGVVFLLIAVACAIFFIVRKATRSRIERQTIISHPPPVHPTGYPPSYPQPGTCYPPPPPPYYPNAQGQTNPGYH